MDYKRIDAGMKPLFQHLAETGITLDEAKLINIIRGFQKRLVEQKQAINREVGFTVNIYSDNHLVRVLGGEKDSGFLFDQLVEARKIGFLIRKLQQIYNIANGNFQVLDRLFGLYPKYGLDMNGQITTVSELALSDLPEEILSVVSRQGMVLMKATYLNIVLQVVQKLSNDSGIDVKSFVSNLAKSKNIVSSFFGRTAIVPETESERLRFGVEFPIESTAMDIAKLGFIGLFEDYRIGKLDSQIFAIAPYSVYLFAPEEHDELISSVCRECLESAHTDFALSVDITTGSSLDRLA
jgi:hypothetical protein